MNPKIFMSRHRYSIGLMALIFSALYPLQLSAGFYRFAQQKTVFIHHTERTIAA